MSEHAHDAHAEHHVLPVGLYLKVYGALLVLTYLTVQVSVWGLGEFSVPVAMAVAVVKAGFVIGFFMHLRYDTRFHSLIFFGTILFLAIFATFTLFDLTARGRMVQEIDSFTFRAQERAKQEAIDAEALAQTPPNERAEPEPEPESHGPSHKPMSDKDWESLGLFGPEEARSW